MSGHSCFGSPEILVPTPLPVPPGAQEFFMSRDMRSDPAHGVSFHSASWVEELVSDPNEKQNPGPVCDCRTGSDE